MKANELMIGDFCRCGEILVKITRISENSASGLDLSALSPIPLTAEILEKNGFVSTYRAEDNGDYKIPYNPFTVHYEDGFIWYGEVFGYDIDYSYVHELQHALRLCGLSELADSFIV